MIINEITNQLKINCEYSVRIRKAIKTEARYMIFMDYCNCNDLKEVMDFSASKINFSIAQKIISFVVRGLYALL